MISPLWFHVNCTISISRRQRQRGFCRRRSILPAPYHGFMLTSHGHRHDDEKGASGPTEHIPRHHSDAL